MKTTLKLLLTVVTLTFGFAAPSAIAQQGGNKRVEMMTEQLDLTPDQVTELKAIIKSQNQAMKAVKEAGGDKAAMQAVRKEHNQKIQAMLTPAQMKKMKMAGNKDGGGDKKKKKGGEDADY